MLSIEVGGSSPFAPVNYYKRSYCPHLHGYLMESGCKNEAATKQNFRIQLTPPAAVAPPAPEVIAC